MVSILFSSRLIMEHVLAQNRMVWLSSLHR